VGIIRAQLFSLSPFYVSLVMAHQWEIALFWPIASWHLYCDAHLRMRLQSKGPLKVSLKSEDLRFFTCR
jgi:hypothetical protein